jgi:predicted phosphodiesterase
MKMKRKRSLKLAWTSFVLALLFPAACEEEALRSSAPQASWQFIVTGDSRSDGQNNGVNVKVLGELAREIVANNVDFVLVPGDLVNGYDDPETMESQFDTWRKTMEPVYDAGIGVHVVRGNHDIGEPEGTSAWNNAFDYLPDNGPAGEKNLTYSISHKNALLVAVDQYVDEEQRINQNWLDKQFAANTKPHVFVFGHEPAFQALHEDCIGTEPRVRDKFWASIAKAGGRTYFCGHDHFYDHARVDNDGDPANDVHQYIVGTAGAPLYRWSPPYKGDNSDYTVDKIYHARKHGYVLVGVDGFDVTLTWMQRTGPGKYQPKETFSYTAVLAPQQ